MANNTPEMDYLKSPIQIKNTLFGGKKKLLRFGKKILTAPEIIQYADNHNNSRRANFPLFATITDGLYSIYNANTKSFVLQDAQPFNTAFREQSGVPVCFKKNEYIYYVTPAGKCYDVTKVGELCFSIDPVTGNPTHDLVFYVNNNRPHIVYRNPDFNLAESFFERSPQDTPSMIGRIRHDDVIENPYTPLMLTTLDEVHAFMQKYPITKENLSKMRQMIATANGLKKNETLKKDELFLRYLQTMMGLYQPIVQGEDKRYNSTNIPMYIRREHHTISRLQKDILDCAANVEYYQTEINTTQATLAAMTKTSNDWNENFESIELVEQQEHVYRQKRDEFSKQITADENLIEQKEVLIAELYTRGSCLVYLDKLATAIEQQQATVSNLQSQQPVETKTEVQTSATTLATTQTSTKEQK